MYHAQSLEFSIKKKKKNKQTNKKLNIVFLQILELSKQPLKRPNG